ncbi:MAG: DUF885 family protein [Vicinamibacteria bacterium]
MSVEKPVAAATQWLDRFFDHSYRSNPVGATFVGERGWDHRLPDYSERGREGARSVIDSLLAESSALDVASLSVAERHDVCLATGALRIQMSEMKGRHFQRGNPSLYTGEAAFGLISLFLTDFAPLAERVEASVERMNALPAFFAQVKANVDAAPAAWTDRAIRETDGLLALLADGLPSLAGMSEATALRAIEVAREATVDFRRYLELELAAHPRGDVAAGEEALALNLAEGHFLAEGAAEIERYARAELVEVKADLVTRAKEFGVNTPAEVLALLKEHCATANQYEGQYQRVWEESRTLADSKGLLSWPDFPVRYVARPAWVKSAAPHLYFLFYRSPAAVPSARPPIHEYLIPTLDATPTADSQRAFLEAHNDSVIKLNHVVHHGGIGHHVQNFHAFRAASRIGRMAAVDCASRIALLCGGTMAEGWACYATDLMGEAGFLTPLERYAERQGRARMCARAIVDVKVHRGEWTLDQAARFYEEDALMPRAAAMSEAVKNSMFPATAVMYLMGRDAIHRLRSEMQRLQGREFSLKGFHDEFLSYGSIPVRLIAAAMKERRRPF